MYLLEIMAHYRSMPTAGAVDLVAKAKGVEVSWLG